jgi:hypothetical protein
MRHALIYRYTLLNQRKTVEEEVNNKCIYCGINYDGMKTRQAVYI